jgi:hypothetical protein
MYPVWLSSFALRFVRFEGGSSEFSLEAAASPRKLKLELQTASVPFSLFDQNDGKQ